MIIALEENYHDAMVTSMIRWTRFRLTLSVDSLRARFVDSVKFKFAEVMQYGYENQTGTD